MKKRAAPGFTLLDLLVCFAVGLLTFGLSIPLLRAGKLVESEERALENLIEMARHLTAVSSDPPPEPDSVSPPVPLTWEKILARPLGTGKFYARGARIGPEEILEWQGYFFKLYDFPEGPGICAWPEHYSQTGLGMFLFQPKDSFFESRNDRRCYSGRKRIPKVQKSFPTVLADNLRFAKDGQEWRIFAPDQK